MEEAFEAAAAAAIAAEAEPRGEADAVQENSDHCELEQSRRTWRYVREKVPAYQWEVSEGGRNFPSPT